MWCRTCASKWDLWNSWWNFEYLRNSFPWIQMLPMSKTWTFPKSLSAFLLNLQRSTFFSVFFALCLLLYSQILVRHPIRYFRNQPAPGNALTQASPFYRESALRTLHNAQFCREEVPHDEGQPFAMYTKTFPQVSPIDRAPLPHFSTLEKPKIDHNPSVNNLILTFPQVSPFDRLPQQIFQDLDIHTKSSPGLTKLKKTRPRTSSLLNSSFVLIWMWHVLLLILVELVLPLQRCKL